MKRATTVRGRFYDADGKKYPSVTTILSCVGKPALVAWSANVERELCLEESGNFYRKLVEEKREISKMAWLMQLTEFIGKKKANKRLLEKAGDIGTQAHKFIEWLLSVELCKDVEASPEIGPEAQYAVAAWKEWRSGVSFKPILIEKSVVSHVHGYAGTMDYLCAEIDGVETLCDWKTGKRIYYEAHLQNAAYRVAAREMGLANPQAGLLLRLPKTKDDPSFEAVPAREEETCFRVFLAVKQLWTDMDAEDKWAAEQEKKQEVSA